MRVMATMAVTGANIRTMDTSRVAAMRVDRESSVACLSTMTWLGSISSMIPQPFGPVPGCTTMSLASSSSR